MAENELETKEELKNEVTEEQKIQNEELSELQKKQIELDELDDRYKRVFAEFENYKKRTQKEKDSLYNVLLGDIVTKILPLIDNLEMAANAECKDESYKQGIELVEKQFKDFLVKNRIEEIPTIGETFDPSVHEAVSSIQDDTKEPGEIVQEYRKGYKIGSKVLRHAMVVVNQ